MVLIVLISLLNELMCCFQSNGFSMNIFEQMKQQMQEQLNKQQQSSYLLPSDLNTVVELLYNLSGGRTTQPDVTRLEGCNVIAVLPVGCYMLFSINPDNEVPPNRNVKCYSQGNGFYTERDVVEVFNFIQKNSLAWCQV